MNVCDHKRGEVAINNARRSNSTEMENQWIRTSWFFVQEKVFVKINTLRMAFDYVSNWRWTNDKNVHQLKYSILFFSRCLRCASHPAKCIPFSLLSSSALVFSSFDLSDLFFAHVVASFVIARTKRKARDREGTARGMRRKLVPPMERIKTIRTTIEIRKFIDPEEND